MAVPLRAGDVVVDKYRIERHLGAGGMGVVVEATHLQLNQPVALKFLVDSGFEPDVAAERFLREARATFRLRSEHTVRVMDVGTLPTGQPFMVMELLVGKDFKQLVAERGPLPVAEAGEYMLQVCAALQEAHAFGIVHRDLKARNLYLTRRVDGSPCVKVLDFGISKLQADRDTAPLTVPETGMGSPRYMAPEQWTNASTVDARADIYAAGAVFYELLTGNIPLGGLPLAEVIKRIRAGAVPSPKESRPDLPDAICRVVLRALRPRPEERYPTALHFAQAIRDALPDPRKDARPNPVMAMTVPTAVMNREAVLARAQIDAHMARAKAIGPGSAVPTMQQRPAVPRPASSGAPVPSSTDPDGMPQASTLEDEVVSSTLEEGIPIAVQVPETKPLPAVRPIPSMEGEEFAEDAATIVTRSPAEEEEERAAAYAAPPQHATLQVAEAPPEIQALRTKYTPIGAPAVALPSLFDETTSTAPARPVPLGSPAPPLPAPPPPLLSAQPVQHLAASPFPLQPSTPSLPPELPARRIPSWLFWGLLVISFCFAGGVAAAILMRFLP
jgi:serine/threonine protein kinase